MPVLKDIAAIAKGMSITFMEMFQPTQVENYPDGKGPLKGAQFQERFRGMHVLQRDENGLEKCVACFLCAANCPSNCIYIEAAENTDEKRVSGAERYATARTNGCRNRTRAPKWINPAVSAACAAFALSPSNPAARHSNIASPSGSAAATTSSR